MPLPAGTKLGPYEILTLLGAGGMGEVYRALDTRLDRAVAIKTSSERFSGRFEQEARAISALNHSHICTLYDVGPNYLVMELVEGETLAVRLQQGPLAIEQVIRYGAEIADALTAAHSKGITHRDLKPANVMVTKTGVKILDFGLAKRLSFSDDTLTASHAIVGTPAYMAPEQLEGKPCDARTDIFALGLVLYEMATGERLRLGQAANVGELPERFAHVIERCLVTDPGDRWQSARDVQAELEWAGKSEGSKPSKPSTLWIWAAAALACAGLAIAVMLWFLARVSPSGDRFPVEFSVFPPKGTTFGGEGPSPAISPDGRYLAFVALRPDGGQQIWVRPLKSSTARHLQSTQGAMRPFWSSDNRSIGYFANGQLWRVDLDSGEARVVCDAPYQGGLSGTWANDVILFSSAGGLRRVRAGGGPAAIVKAESETFAPNSPSFLPDGRHFLYLEWSRRSEQHRLCVGSLDSDVTNCFSKIQAAARYDSSGNLLFMKDQALLTHSFDPLRSALVGEPSTVSGVQVRIGATYLPPHLSVSGNGVMVYMSPGITPLVWLDRSGGKLEPMGSGHTPRVSRDGRRIAIVRRDPQTGNSDLWLYDRARGTESRFTFDPADDTAPAFSADGEQVLFSSNRSGASQLYQKPASGAGDEKLVAATPGAASADWSSDGRFILYQTSDPKTGFDVWAISLAGDRKPFPVAQTRHGEREGRFSPDVRWVAYDSTESGRREVWVQPFPPTGSKWQISTGGGVSPRWGGDSKELFYVAADGMLTAVAIDAGPTFERGAPRPLFQTMFRGGVYANFAVSHDGKRFLMNVPPGLEDVTPITVVLNWTALLGK